MNIEQIVASAAEEVWSAGDLYMGPRAESLEAFLHLCLAKLAAQDVEPVADVVWFDPATEPFQKTKPHKIIDGSLSFMDEVRIGTKLYTEAQLLAVQQRTAEACAKVCDEQHDKALTSSAAHRADCCATRIRNGEWRNHK